MENRQKVESKRVHFSQLVFLRIPYLGSPDDELDTDHKLLTVTRIVDEQIDYIERQSLADKLDPDIAYELIERCKRPQARPG